ncbi:MAG TPA: hypothetical protein VNK89_10650 [Thermoflexus sp.]|nr:hypothetical protein [Thermoflexus sp.]
MSRFYRGGMEIIGLTGLALGLAVLLSGIQGGITFHRISDSLFWIGLVYFLIAAFPAVAEIGSNMAAPWEALREQRPLAEVIHDQRARYAPWMTVTWRFGLAALLCLAIGLGFGLI